MPGRDFLFGFKFLATDYVSPILKNIETRIESVNAQVKNTGRWREAGTNVAIMGGGLLAAGGAVVLALRSSVNAAMEMQTEMSHVATAINDGAASHIHLAQAQALSEKLSIASGLAAKQEAEAYYIARSNMLDHAQAMAAVDVATKLTIGTTGSLAEAQTQLEPTTRLLTTVFQNFGQKGLDANKQIAGFADTMAKLQTNYSFRTIDEVNQAMSYAVPLAKSAGISFKDMSAAIATLSLSGKHGAEAGTAFAELAQKLSTEPKLRGLLAHTAAGGIDLGATMDLLKAKVAGYTPIQEAMYLKQLGFTERSIVGVSLLIDKMNLYHSAVTGLSDAQGANAAAFATRQATMEIATGRLSAAWDVFKSKIGEQLIGPMTTVVNMLTSAVGWVTNLATNHSEIAKFVVTFVAIGAALAVAAGGIAVVVGGLMAFGSYIGIAAGAVWTFTQVALAVSLVGAAVRMCWSTISSFAPAIFAAGANLIKALASGIRSAITFPQHAIEAVLTKVRAYLPFSPAHEGPLRNLNRMRIVETMAETIRPGPALAAIRRTAAAIAIAAPMTVAPMIASPAYAARAFGAPAAGGGVVINYSPTINMPPGSNAQDLFAVLRQHSRELKEIVDGRRTHEERREF